jgi:hypothetical protein
MLFLAVSPHKKDLASKDEKAERSRWFRLVGSGNASDHRIHSTNRRCVFSLLVIVLIVIVILALLGFFGYRR